MRTPGRSVTIEACRDDRTSVETALARHRNRGAGGGTGAARRFGGCMASACEREPEPRPWGFPEHPATLMLTPTYNGYNLTQITAKITFKR